MTIPVPEASIASISPAGDLLIVQPEFGMGRRAIRLFTFPGGEQITFPSEKFEERDIKGVYPAEFSPDGKILFTRSYVEERDAWLLRLLELPSGAERLRIESADPCVGCLSADGRKLVYLSKDEPRIRMIDVATRAEATSRVSGTPIGISPDGRTLLTEADSGNAGNSAVKKRLVWWDIETGHQILVLNTVTRRGWPTNFRFSPDGTKLAVNVTNEGGQQLKLWDTASGREVLSLPPAQSFAFVLGGKVLAAAQTRRAENCVRCWNVETGCELEPMVPAPPAGFFHVAGFSPAVSASSDGRLLRVDISAQRYRPLPWWLPRWKWIQNIWPYPKSSQTMVVYDMHTREELLSLPLPRNAPVSFSPDKTKLAFGGGKVVQIWDLPPHRSVWLALAIASLVVTVIFAGWQAYLRNDLPLWRRGLILILAPVSLPAMALYKHSLKVTSDMSPR